MGKKVTHKKIDWEKISLYALVSVGCVFLVLLLWSLFDRNGSKMIKQHNTSNLINTEEIANLSVCEFIYNGIAQSMKNDEEPDYNVLYKSTVKVSVDASNIMYSVDEERKAVTIRFSGLTIENPIIDIASVSLIPNRDDLLMDDVIALCRNDALAEARKSDKLISSARENLQSIITAWYSPVYPGYSFEFEYGFAEVGEIE